MKNLIRNKYFFPVLLLFLCFLTYGLFIPFLGFYWDDFPYLWFRHTTGVSGVIQAIALDRPLLAAFYAIPMSILGESPVVWQIAAIIARWLFTLSTYKFLKKLWPEKQNAIRLLTLLVLVFPGFKQQWISVIYTHVFIVFALYFYSLSLFVKSIKARNRFSPALVFSILISVFCMTAVEYVAGLELIKPFIIFMLISIEETKTTFFNKLIKTIKLWIPYLLSFLLFLFYRVFIASSVLYKVQQMDGLTSNPFHTIINMIVQQFRNVYASTVPVWTQTLDPLSTFDLSTLFSKLYLAVFILLLGVTLFFLSKMNLENEKDNKWLLQLAIGGGLSLLAAGLPFWAANLNPSVNFPSDRILLPFMLGSCVLVFVLFRLFSKWKIIFNILFSLVFSLSAVFQLYQANQFRNDWEYFQQFTQQLSWRIPSLKEDTLLVAKDLPLEYYSDNSLTAVFNWIYADQIVQKLDDKYYSMPYLINYTESRLGSSLSSLEAGTTVNHNYRTFTFNGSTDQMIIFYHEPPGCVHIVDPDLDMYNPLLPAFLRDYVENSRDDLVGAETAQNDVFFLTKETANSWCYYYEKASLAAELGQWEQVVELASTAFALDDHPNDASERIPFIKGYARTGDWTKALQLSKTTAQISELYHPMLCQLWQNLDNEMDESTQKAEAVRQITSIIDCPF